MPSFPRARRALTALLVLASAAALAPAATTTSADVDETVVLLVGRSTHLSPPWAAAGVALTDPEVADVQVPHPNMLLVSGRGPGVTDAVLWSDEGETWTLRIEVGLDLDRLSAELRGLLPGAEVRVEQAQGVAIVSGRLRDAEQSVRLAEYLDARELPYVDATTLPGVQQVQVQVRIAEVSRESLRSLGVNALKTADDFFGGVTVGSSSGGPINPISIGALGGTAAGDNLPFAFTSSTSVSPSVTLFAGFPKADLEVFVQALAENDYLRILAEPTLVALSGEEARFLAGGEFPIPVVQGSTTGGGSTITIEYRDFGVALAFEPVVLGDGRIRLQVESEVSDLTDIGAVEIEGFRIPALVTRNAATTLEMGSGQTFSIAGLISETTSAQVSRVPGLGSLPILGPLFRSVRYQTGETELVVLVTASLVEPLSTTAVPPLPGEDHVAPSDWELFLEAELEGTPPRLSPLDAEALRGLGLDGLRGPGAWATHHDAPVPARGRPDRDGAGAGADTDASGDED